MTHLVSLSRDDSSSHIIGSVAWQEPFNLCHQSRMATKSKLQLARSARVRRVSGAKQVSGFIGGKGKASRGFILLLAACFFLPAAPRVLAQERPPAVPLVTHDPYF